jgi:O-antigen/teichoic acid export membrane protein
VEFPFFPYAMLSFIPVFFTIFFSFYLSEKKIKGEAWKYLKAAISNSIFSAAAAIIFVAILGWGAIGRLGATLLTSIVFGLFGIKYFLNYRTFDFGVLRKAIKFSWPISLSAMLMFLFRGVDKIYLERIGDSTSFGNYNVAFQITTYLGFFGTALMQTFDPDIYKSIANRDIRKLARIILLILIPCIIAAVVFILAARPIISILTYGRYLDSVPFARILALRNITTPLAFVLSGILIGFGFPKADFVTRVIAAIFSLFLFKYLIDVFGFHGAAWGQVISMSLMALGSLSFILIKGRKSILEWPKSY